MSDPDSDIESNLSECSESCECSESYDYSEMEEMSDKEIVDITDTFPQLLLDILNHEQHSDLTEQPSYQEFCAKYLREGVRYLLLIDGEECTFDNVNSLFYGLSQECRRRQHQGVKLREDSDTAFYINTIGGVMKKIQSFLRHEENANDLAAMMTGL